MTEALGPVGYIVTVLWMHGESGSRIGKAVGWSRDKVLGHVWRHFEQRPRASFSLEERQAVLDELKASRMDNGRLRDEHFIAKPTAEKYIKPKEVAADPYAGIDMNTRAGRREARKIKQALEAAAELERKKQEARQLGHADRRGRTFGTKEKTTSSALEYLFDHRLLKDAGGENGAAAKEGILPEESRRLEAGLRMRALIQGARTASLGAIDYERATMGAGGGPKLSLAAFKLHCIQQLGTLRKLMQGGEYVIAESIVDQDVFIWESEEPGSKERGAMFESIRYLLDLVGVHELLMTRESFKARWGEDLPVIDHARRDAASAQSELAGEVIASARGGR